MPESATLRYPIKSTINIDYNKLIESATFNTPEDCIYKFGIQCCDRCYCNINEVEYNKGMWSCAYEVNVNPVSFEANYARSIILHFDICMDCYETIIGPMKYKLYKHNPNIDSIAHDIVIKGLTSYYTCSVMSNAYYLCVYINEEFAISDTELKECVDELQTKINELALHNTQMDKLTNNTDKMDTTPF
jgi:hypothetical protein